MSLFDLKSLVSNEDFADAHEPLNDGVKEVPNAQTVAASVKTGDVGKDTTSQGPAKVIKEKPDNDDATKTEHNTVKESAEKPGAKPATPAAPPKSDETKEDSGDSSDKPAKPFEPKEPADEADDEELEHTSEKSVKDDLEKTEKATKGLEAYSLKARRFDIIGHPKVQAAEVCKMISYLNRRAGITGEITISSESIDAAIAVGQARLARLEREAAKLSRNVSNEDISDSMGIDNTVVEEAIVTAAPTEHGAPPMAPEAAAALTEQEIDPLDVPVLEIQRVQETMDVLAAGQVAIEQYRQIIRDNPRMSKQAAAVLHAGLDHIDKVCGLKVRSTGFESYQTTPRAAMEDADDVSEKTLGARAGEIGAKIMQWIKKMIDYAVTAWEGYKTGVAGAIRKVGELNSKLANIKDSSAVDSVILKNPSEYLFIDGEFIGTGASDDEDKAYDRVTEFYSTMDFRGIDRINKVLRSGTDLTSIEQGVKEAISVAEVGSIWTDGAINLPGNKVVSVKGDRLELSDSEGTKDIPSEVEVDVDLNQLKNNFKNLERFLGNLQNSRLIAKLKSNSSDMVSEFVNLRKRLGKDVDEAAFQELQTITVAWLNKTFDLKVYFQVVGAIAKCASAKIHLGETVCGAFK